MPYLTIVPAILLFAASVRSVQQFEDLADGQTPSKLNYPSDISVSNNPDALAYANIDLKQNEPNSVSTDHSPHSADQDKSDIPLKLKTSSPLINTAATSDSAEVAIGDGGGFGRGGGIGGIGQPISPGIGQPISPGIGGGLGPGITEGTDGWQKTGGADGWQDTGEITEGHTVGGTDQGQNTGEDTNEGIGGIGRGGIGGITPPEWWQDLAPPVCKETSSDGKLKTPACCARPRKNTKRGRPKTGTTNNEGEQFWCKKFSSYNQDCYNAATVFCCKEKFANNRKGLECNRPGEGYPQSGQTPVRAKAPATPLAPANLPADQVAPNTNLPPDRVIDPQTELNIPGASELLPAEGVPAEGVLIEP